MSRTNQQKEQDLAELTDLAHTEWAIRYNGNYFEVRAVRVKKLRRDYMFYINRDEWRAFMMLANEAPVPGDLLHKDYADFIKNLVDGYAQQLVTAVVQDIAKNPHRYLMSGEYYGNEHSAHIMIQDHNNAPHTGFCMVKRVYPHWFDISSVEIDL